MAMTFKGLLKGAVLGAGTVILFAGLALAQAPAPAPVPATPPAAAAPAPAPTPPAASPQDRRAAMHKLRDECRTKTADLKGPERREGMRKCMTEGRPAAIGGNAGGGMGRIGKERAKAVRDECRTELKDQRFTEAERRKAMEDCAIKKEPALAKPIACRREAEEKKLERGSEPFRSFMRGCITRN